MLHLVDMGPGTCWLGGTFKRSELAEILNTSEDVVIPAITPVGYPAPSASNKQPWRIVRAQNNFHFFLSRTPGYGGFAPNVDIQRLDMGIAMAHFELRSREAGLEGSWEIMDHGVAMQKGTECIVSWKQGNSAGL